MRDEATDEKLVEEHLASGESDLRAFEKLVARHQERVVTNCRYITRMPDDAQDLAQEVFVKAFFALPRFEKRSSFKTWVQRIKVNHCLNFLKKRQGVTTVPVDDPVVEQRPEMTVRTSDRRSAQGIHDRQRIAEVLDAMSETLRVPLLLRDMDGYSYQEIAETLGVGLSAAKMRIKRAREEFRERYEA